MLPTVPLLVISCTTTTKYNATGTLPTSTRPTMQHTQAHSHTTKTDRSSRGLGTVVHTHTHRHSVEQSASSSQRQRPTRSCLPSEATQSSAWAVSCDHHHNLLHLRLQVAGSGRVSPDELVHIPCNSSPHLELAAGSLSNAHIQ